MHYTVKGINILSGTKFKKRAGELADFIDRLIHAAFFRNGLEHFTRLGNLNNTFLRHIGAFDFYNGNSTVLSSCIRRHIKEDWRGIQYIPIRGCCFHE